MNMILYIYIYMYFIGCHEILAQVHDHSYMPSECKNLPSRGIFHDMVYIYIYTQRDSPLYIDVSWLDVILVKSWITLITSLWNEWGYAKAASDSSKWNGIFQGISPFWSNSIQMVIPPKNWVIPPKMVILKKKHADTPQTWVIPSPSVFFSMIFPSLSLLLYT